MDNKSENIVSVLIENKRLTSTDLNIIAIGQDISKKMSCKLAVIGINLDVESIDYIKQLDCKLLNINHLLLYEYNINVYAKAISQAIRHIMPKYVLFTTTQIGKELSPKISSIFNTGMISDAIKYEITSDGELLVDKPSYGDQVYAKIGFKCLYPRIISFRQVFNLGNEKYNGNFEYDIFHPDISDNDIGLKIKKIEYLEDFKEEGDRLENAKIIIGAGLGIEKIEILELVYKLAKLINAEVGVTKALVDKGWCNKDLQIGQTGKITNPDIYIAFGISGASQHTVGFEGAKKVIAINKNKDANIFNIADVGIIGDAESILNGLVKNLNKSKVKS